MKKTWIASLLIASSLLGAGILPARAADENMQIQLLKQIFRLPQPDWPGLLGENRNLLDETFFQRCDARIRWGLENNQIDDALRFSIVSDTAMKVNGQKGSYRMTLVYAFIKSNNEPMALDLLTNIQLTDPGDPESLYVIANIMKAQGNAVEAYTRFKKLADEGYRKSDCLLQMAIIDVVVEKVPEALKEVRAALELDPNNEGAKQLLVALEKNQPKFAPEGVKFNGVPLPETKGVAVSQDTVTKANNYFNEAEAFFKAGDISRAKAGYQRAVETNPNMEKAYVYLGALLYRAGEIDAAIKQLGQALAYNPKDAEALRYIGFCFERRFDEKGSRQDLEQAIVFFQRGSNVASSDIQLKSDLERVTGKRSPSASR